MYTALSVATIIIFSGTFSFRILSLSDFSSMKVVVPNGAGGIDFMFNFIVLSALSLKILEVEECDTMLVQSLSSSDLESENRVIE